MKLAAAAMKVGVLMASFMRALSPSQMAGISESDGLANIGNLAVTLAVALWQ